MREIKFRAWDIFLHRMYFDTEYIMVCHDKIFYKYGSVDFKISATRCEFMQFTGLLDKNGTEIYEGDILKSWYSRDLSMKDIVYTQEVVEYEIEQYLGEAGFEIPFLHNAQVIGNIYENKDLINV